MALENSRGRGSEEVYLDTPRRLSTSLQTGCPSEAKARDCSECAFEVRRSTMDTREDAMQMLWRCDDDAMAKRWWRGGDAVAMRWRCDEDATEMRRRCGGDAVSMRCRFESDAMEMRVQCNGGAYAIR